MDSIHLSSLSYTEKLILCSRLRQPFNMHAVFSDETRNFISNPEPAPGETVTVKIRTAKGDALSISLIGAGPHPMRLCESAGPFDYFSVDITVYMPIAYYFEIKRDSGVYCYNKAGIVKEPDPHYHFSLLPGVSSPDWAKSAVIYQIFVDRFYNGDKSNDVLDFEYSYMGRPSKKMDWDTPVAPDDICKFYGGDLQGVIEKLPYLQSLGVDAIYLNPIFVSPSSHKYDIQDYDYVDPHFGKIVSDGGDTLSKERFNNRFASKYEQRTTNLANLNAGNRLAAELIAKSHEHGIKVILDGVFNHCGAFNKWLDKEGFYMRAGYPEGAYRNQDSPYHDYFSWFESMWPNNDCYFSWWGHANHPKLNFENSAELENYIIEIGKKWVSPPYNADGWRLDVAADLGQSREYNHSFWEKFASAVKSQNPDALILAEHYGDASSWLNAGEWDTIMNYDAFMEPVTWFLTGMEKHSDDFREGMRNNTEAFWAAMIYHMATLSYKSLYSAMNELSNHDHSRFLTRTNNAVGRLHTLGTEAAGAGVDRAVFFSAVVIQMTWPGAPTIYYGDEAGLPGWTDPDNRRPFPWGEEDTEFTDLHRAAIKLRKRYSALRLGSLMRMPSENGLLCYARFDDENEVVVIVNNSTSMKLADIPVHRLGVQDSAVFTAQLSTSVYSFQSEETASSYAHREIYTVVNGFITVLMQGRSSLVLVR